MNKIFKINPLLKGLAQKNFRIKLVQTCSNLFKLGYNGSNWFMLDPNRSKLFKVDQIGSNWIKLVQTCSNLIKLDANGSKWNKVAQS